MNYIVNRTFQLLSITDRATYTLKRGVVLKGNRTTDRIYYELGLDDLSQLETDVGSELEGIETECSVLPLYDKEGDDAKVVGYLWQADPNTIENISRIGILNVFNDTSI